MLNLGTFDLHEAADISEAILVAAKANYDAGALGVPRPLDARDRAVVWLHDVEGYGHQEIADLFGKTESFSKSQLSRAYQKLRPMLAQQLEQEGGATAALGSM